ncbi:MAG: BatA domain-containing protein [Planctomycetaceae bacterium]
MSFLAPWMLWGLALASAPIIIHLLNRRRFIRVDWAPMEFLKLTIKTNRRRLRLEQWLLLALRTLLVVVLFLALARPVGTRDSLAGFFAKSGRTTRVVVLDDSLSMGYRADNRTAFQDAVEAAKRLLDQIASQDGISVMLASEPSQPILRHAHIDDAAPVVATLDGLTLSEMSPSWANVFNGVDELLATSPFPLKEVVLVTDLRAQGWDAEVTGIVDRWASENVTLRIIDVAQSPLGNMVLESLELKTPVPLRDAKVLLEAKIRNDGEETSAALTGILSVDEQTSTVTFPEIPPEESVTVAIPVSFDAVGFHQIELTLPADRLNGDNRDLLVVDVRETLDVMLVDGEPGSRPFESETDFLAAVFSAGASPWKVTRLTDTEWSRQTMVPPDVLVLANVSSIPDERLKELEELVSRGMGLMIFAGDQIDAGSYNLSVYRNGSGLLPAEIGQIRDQDVDGLVLEPSAESPLHEMEQMSPEMFSEIRPHRIQELGIEPGEGDAVQVLARWNVQEQTPAIVAKTVGAGRVVLFGLTADRNWSDWPVQPSFVLASRLTVQSIAARNNSQQNLTAGQLIHWDFTPAQSVTSAAMTPPVHAEQNPAQQAASLPLSIDREDPQRPFVEFTNTRSAGFYDLSWQSNQASEIKLAIAVGPDVRDSRLDRLLPAQQEQFLGRIRPQIVGYNEQSLAGSNQGAELWRSAMFCVLGFVVFESMLAAWVGRTR